MDNKKSEVNFVFEKEGKKPMVVKHDSKRFQAGLPRVGEIVNCGHGLGKVRDVVHFNGWGDKYFNPTIFIALKEDD